MGAEGRDKKWVVCRDFQLGHDFIVLYVAHACWMPHFSRHSSTQ